MTQTNNGMLSDKELQESYWIVTHAERIRHGIMRTVVILEAIIILAFVVQFVGYLYYTAVRNARIVQPLLTQAQQAFPVFTLETPRIMSSGVIERGTGIVDLYAALQNQQANWRVSVPVIFSINGVEQPPVSTFLFPGDTKYVFFQGIAASAAEGVSARVAKPSWTRLNQSDIAALSKRRMIAVSDIQLQSGRSPSGVFIRGTRLLFALENKAVYHLYNFRVIVVAKNGSTPVAALTLPVFSLMRNEKLSLEARWDYQFAATEYEVIPDIDVLVDTQTRPAL